MKTIDCVPVRLISGILFVLWAAGLSSQILELRADNSAVWHLSVQYLGLTWHPGGGGNAELYPLKFEEKGYVVPEIGGAASLDYRLGRRTFFRITSGLYKDCAFVMAGCVHAGPRIQFSWGKNSLNAGIGPIFSFRQDWHRFDEYETDAFYGERVYHGWQYRLFPYAVELEYLRGIDESKELQWSLIPGAPLVITFMFGIRFELDRPGH
ncbi:hypothetical protein JW948_08380 [bacterium]|nr:hypothetical protein [bacterium]